MIEHPVDDDPGYRHIHPDGKSHAGPFFVGRDALFNGEVHRADGKDGNQCRQGGVRRQDGQVQGPVPALTGIAMNSGHIKAEQVDEKKEYRTDKGPRHTDPMSRDVMLSNRKITYEQ